MTLPSLCQDPTKAKYLVVSSRFHTLTYFFETPEQLEAWLQDPHWKHADWFVRTLGPYERGKVE